jgi:hypothetical protein
MINITKEELQNSFKYDKETGMFEKLHNYQGETAIEAHNAYLDAKRLLHEGCTI